MIELLPLVDETGKVIGRAPRTACHGNPALIHPVVHLHVFGSGGRLLLQRRSAEKDLLPGFWDTAVGGHIGLGEDTRQALEREALEELGISIDKAKFFYSYVWRTAVESEFVSTFGLKCDGPFRPNPREVAETCFFSRREILDEMGKRFLTPNFEEEFRRLTADELF